MVENTEFAVSALAVEVVGSVVVFIEIDTPSDKLANLPGSAFHYFLNSLGVAEPVAGHHCVVDMFVEIVDFEVGHRCNSALGKGCIGLVEGGFAHQSHASTVAGDFEGETHAGDAGSYHKIVVFKCHFLMLF